jgi:hypothetical protein
LIPMKFRSLYHCVLPVHSRPSVQSVLPCTCHKVHENATSHPHFCKSLLCFPPHYSQ